MLNIVYMGTPDFAVGPLDAIFHSGHTISAVVTAPDKPAGRGKKLTASEVKKFAEQHDLPLLQPVNLRDGAFANIIEGIHPDLIIVIAFRMLPKSIWSIPSKGTINLHASLLPQYRGAAPINWALINGETVSGLTTFFINESIDTGDILMQTTIDIEPSDNFGTLHDKMKLRSGPMILETIQTVENGTSKGFPQNAAETILKTAPKLTKENTRINWARDAASISNQIRGLAPVPGAWTQLYDSQGKENLIKILSASADMNETGSGSCGTIQTDLKSFIHIICSEGVLKVNNLQLSGRSVLSTAEFLRGYAGLMNGAVLK